MSYLDETFGKIDLLSASSDEIISYFSSSERKRDEHDLVKAQREFSIGVRDFPSGLSMVLSQVHRVVKEPVAVITKCLSHPVAAWLDSLPDIACIVDAYAKVANRFSDGGYDDLHREMDSARYAFKFPVPVETITGATTLKSITWVQGRLFDVSCPVGITPARLFCVGLCRCLCLTNKGWAEGTLETLLEPEVNNFLWYLRERLVFLKYYGDLASIRGVRDSGKQNCKLFSRKLGNAVS